MKYGKIAYEAYCKARGWKSINGDPLPHYEQQSLELQQAWANAAQAVVEAIDSQTRRG